MDKRTTRSPLSRGLRKRVRRFVDEEPRREFVWLFRNEDGSDSEYPTTMEEYRRFRASYGVPLGRWRAK